MKRTTLPLVTAALLSAGTAFATPINMGGSETNLQQVLNDITCKQSQPGCVLGGPSSVNVLTDQVTPDELWTLGAAGGAFSQIIIEIAGNASSNRFGIYDAANPNTRVEMFNGASAAGSKSVLSITSDGSVWTGDIFGGTFHDSGINLADNLFGFYLDTPDGVWFSQLSLNSDGHDHMVAYEGKGDQIKLPGSYAGPWSPNEFVLAWEDLPSSRWDYDYNDFVVMVESVRSVPEPGTLALMGLGLAALGFSFRRRQTV